MLPNSAYSFVLKIDQGSPSHVLHFDKSFYNY